MSGWEKICARESSWKYPFQRVRNIVVRERWHFAQEIVSVPVLQAVYTYIFINITTVQTGEDFLVHPHPWLHKCKFNNRLSGRVTRR